MKDNKLYTPDGFRDCLPEEYRRKAMAERRIGEVFLGYGYLPLSSPMLEYIEVFDGAGSVPSRELYKFIDRDGSVLALRSDITPAIARIAATAYKEEDIPLRFSYFANAFRYNEDYQGKLREFTQAGVELIGVSSGDADGEVMALAVKALLAAGLRDFRIDAGHMLFWRGVLEESGLEGECRDRLIAAVVDRDFVAARALVRDRDIPEGIRTIIEELPFFMGGEEVVQRARSLVRHEKSAEALNSLSEVYAVLKCYGVEKYISFDLSMIGHLDYYTGIIFRGYAQGTGQSLIDGGRYDSLMARFGKNLPSVGFAVKVGVLMAALEGGAEEEICRCRPDTLLAYSEAGREAALRVGEEMRAAGVAVENSLVIGDLPGGKAYAARKGMGGVLYFPDGENVVVADLASGSDRICAIAALREGRDGA